MLVLHDETTLLHKTIEIFNGKAIDALECPDRISVIVEAVRNCQSHALKLITSPDKSGGEQLVDLLIAKSHDADYVQHLREIHGAWIEAGILESAADSVLPECFNVFPGLAPSTTAETRRRKPPRDLSARPGFFAFDLSTGISEHTWSSARASANLAFYGGGLLVTAAGNSSAEIGPPRDVLALCRPPGHHCTTRMAGGYCYLNNAVIAVHAIRHFSAKADALPRAKPSVAILDIDFHHGNGTQAYFYSDPSVLYVSLHGQDEYPYYTGHAEETGEGEGVGFNLNLPLPAHSCLEAYLGKLQLGIKRLQEFRPQYLLVSLGFDTYKSDELGSFDLKTDDYRTIASAIRAAEGLREVPSLILLEGGYVLEALGRNMLEFLRGWEDRPSTNSL